MSSVIAQPRRLALVAYLAIATPRGPQRRDTLLAMFWPELDQARARAALRQSLYVLRSALGPDVLETHGHDVVSIQLDAIRCDVVDFDRAIAAGRSQEALDLYQGDLLEGFFISDAPEFERWQAETRRRLRDAALRSALALVGQAEATGDIAAAALHARRAARLGPHDEAVLRRLVALLDKLGDRAGALAAYDEFAQRLGADFEAEPAAETQELVTAVRTREQSAAAPDGQPRLGPIAREAFRRTSKSPFRSKLVLGGALSAAVAAALLLGLKLRAGEAGPRSSTPVSGNVEANNLYARGKVVVQHQSRENDSIAITLFDRAVALDPTFAAARAELSHADVMRAEQFARGDSAAFERAQIAADVALKLDPNLAEAHNAEASLLWWTPGPTWFGPGHFNHERAIQEDKRAIALNPDLDRGHHLLGNIYLHIGLLDQAVAELQRVLKISPRDDNALRRIAEARLYQGRYAEAVTLLRQTDPQNNAPLWTFQMALLLLHLGKNGETHSMIQEYLKAHPEDRGGVVTSARAVWFAMQGDGPHAEQDIRMAIEKGKGYIHFHHAAYQIALAYALLHQPDSAVQWLRRVADGGMPCYPLFASDPFLNNIHNDPGFVAFLHEQKMQWERFRSTL